MIDGLRSSRFRFFTGFMAVGLALVLALALSACFLSEKPGSDLHGPSTETGNPGLLLDEKGQALPKVALRFWQAPESSMTASGQPKAYRLVHEDSSDARGRFVIPDFGGHAGIIEALDNRNQLGRMIPAPVKGDTAKLRIILDTLGALSGVATRGGPWPGLGYEGDAGILIQLIETNRFILTAADGRFTFSQVPPGKYTLAAYALDGHFAPLFLREIEIPSGQSLGLDTLHLTWSPAVAPPPVLGVQAKWDSVTQSVTVSWLPLALEDLAAYVIWSRGADSIWRSLDTVAAPQNTVSLLVTKDAQGPMSYAVTALDQAGNAGPFPSQPNAVIVRPSSNTPSLPKDQVLVQGRVLRGEVGVALATVRFFWLPTSARDSMPGASRLSLADSARFLDSALTDASGVYRLRLPRIPLIIEARIGESKALANASPQGNTSDTLAIPDLTPLPTAVVTGTLSRGGICVACELKQDGFLLIWSKQGPYVTATDAQGRFQLRGLPAGKHDLVFYGTPEGWFYPSFHSLVLKSGDSISLGTVTLAYDSTKPPPAPTLMQSQYDSALGRVRLRGQISYQSVGRTQWVLYRREGLPPRIVATQTKPAESYSFDFEMDVDSVLPGVWFDFALGLVEKDNRSSQFILSPTWRR